MRRLKWFHRQGAGGKAGVSLSLGATAHGEYMLEKVHCGGEASELQRGAAAVDCGTKYGDKG
jgi:hypothetical protein